MINNTSKYLFISVSILIPIFTLIFLYDISLYEALSDEDYIVENLSSFFLFFASFFFLRAFFLTKKVKNDINKWVGPILLTFSILFFWAGGEEISWGQRIFNIATPEDLAAINDQNELNIHNIDKTFFDRVLDRSTILFVLLGSFLLITNKTLIKGIKHPDVFIICAFAMTPFYRETTDLDYYHNVYFGLAALLAFSAYKKFKIAFITVSVTIAISFMLRLVHIEYYDFFPDHGNSANEYKEFLFCLCCMGYALDIMNDLKQKAISISN